MACAGPRDDPPADAAVEELLLFDDDGSAWTSETAVKRLLLLLLLEGAPAVLMLNVFELDISEHCPTKLRWMDPGSCLFLQCMHFSTKFYRRMKSKKYNLYESN